MLVYIEVLMCSPPTMTAFVAVGTCPISAYQLETPLSTSENIEVLEDWSGFNLNTSPSINTPCSTLTMYNTA